jgi:hypothetical protein
MLFSESYYSHLIFGQIEQKKNLIELLKSEKQKPNLLDMTFSSIHNISL